MASSDYRSEAREVSVLMRLSAAEKLRLKQEADEQGLHLQELFELRLLGAIKPRRKSGRPTKVRDSQEELPISRTA